MKGKISLAPYVRSTGSVRHMMLDAILALIVLFIIPMTQTGPRLAVTALLTVAVCFTCEIVFSLVSRTPIGVNDLSCVVTGLVITLLMPVSVPQWLPVTAAVFAIIVAKAPFGGTGRAPFNPAAAGLAFAAVCFPGKLFHPLALGSALPAWGDCAGEPVLTAAALLGQGMRPAADVHAMLWSLAVGPAGQTALLVLLASGAYLIVRKTVNWDGMACFLTAAALIAFLFPRMVGTRGESVVFELLSGSLLFSSVFLVGEPSTSPRTRLGRCLYGAGAGVLTMILRHVGAYEEGVFFAVLLLNALTPWLDRVSWKLSDQIRQTRERRSPV